MTLEAKKNGNPISFVSNPLTFVPDPRQFNQKILEGRIEQFKKASLVKAPVVFFDRGIPDVLGYMNFFQQHYQTEFEDACRTHRYDFVILLPPWESISEEALNILCSYKWQGNVRELRNCIENMVMNLLGFLS